MVSSSGHDANKSPVVNGVVGLATVAFGVTVALAVWKKWRTRDADKQVADDNLGKNATTRGGVPRAAVKAGGARKPNKKKNKSYARAEKAARKARQAEKRAGSAQLQAPSEGTTLYNPYSTYEPARKDLGRVAALKKFGDEDNDELMSSNRRA